MKLKTLADVSVTATPVVKRLPESGGVYTLTNSGATYSIFVLHDPDTIQESNVTTFAGTAAVIEALGGVEILPGQGITISGIPWFHVVCATGETSTLVITAGATTTTINATVNVGNVGLVNAAETEINPAVSVVEDAAHSSGEAVNPVAAVRTDTRASLAGTTGDWAPPQLNANGELRVRSDDNCKGLVVPQADDAANAGAATYEAAITIPASVLAVRMYLDAAMYVVVDNTTGNPTNTGAPVPADRLVDIPCVGCTKLHIAQVAGNVVVKYSYVYAS